MCYLLIYLFNKWLGGWSASTGDSLELAEKLPLCLIGCLGTRFSRRKEACHAMFRTRVWEVRGIVAQALDKYWLHCSWLVF